MSTVPKITQEHLDAAADQMSGYELMLDFVNKVIELALAEQQEGEYITAAQARELGAGNAEWLNPFTQEWRICVKDLRYLETMSNDGKNVIKYRAIKQAQPEPIATIKLDGNMVTPEQAAAEREAKKETHDVWASFRGDDYLKVIYAGFLLADYPATYELRLKPAKQPTWTGSREDVIALLKEWRVI